MSSIGQIMRNRFPHWTKIRKDSSSDAAILLNTLGHSILKEKSFLYKLNYQMNPLHGFPVCEPGNMFVINTFESSKVQNLLNDIRKLTNISFTGTRNNTEINLSEVLNYDSLCLALPTELGLANTQNIENYILHTFDETTYNHKLSNVYDFKIPKKICFNIKNVTYFKQISNDNQNENKIIITGIDTYGRRTQETILIKNEGYYESVNFYKKLLPLEKEEKYSIVKSDSIEIVGVYGVIDVLALPVRINLKEHHCHYSVLKEDQVKDNFSLQETFLTLNLNNSSYSNSNEETVNYSTLEHIHRMYDYGSLYKNELSDVEKERYEITKFSKMFLDAGYNPITIEDYCFDYVRNYITTISKDNKIRWYSVHEIPFQTKEFERSRKTVFSLDSINQRVSFNQEETLYLDLERPKGSITSFFIGRRKPSQKEVTIDSSTYGFEYLQADKTTWSTNFNYFNINPNSSTVNIVNNLYVNVVFDEIGQHDFYCFTFKGALSQNLLTQYSNNEIEEDLFKKGLDKILENPRQTSLFVNTYSIMCEYSLPVLELESPVDVSGSNYQVGLFYQNSENTLYVVKQFQNTCEIHEIKQYKDYFLYDYDNNIGVLLEQYDSLSFTLENDEEEVVSYD